MKISFSRLFIEIKVVRRWTNYIIENKIFEICFYYRVINMDKDSNLYIFRNTK